MSPDKPQPLVGKTTLITGAARRIGATVAEVVHAAGSNVVIHYGRSGDEAKRLTERLNEARPGSALAISADLLNIEQLPTLVERTLGQFGRLDILINNASTFYPTPLGKITERQWDDLVGVNFKVPLFLCQAAAPALRENRGAIINMVDIHALRPLRDHPVYCSAKAALLMLTRSLARELGPQVRVNGIAPGPILWPESGLEDKQKRKIIEHTALRRAGSPEDIARCVLYLACDADFVTGQIIPVDGGRSI